MILLVGCSKQPLLELTPTVETAHTIIQTAIVPSATPQPDEPTPTLQPAPRLTEYSLDVVFDYTMQHLSVDETVLYTNNSPVPISQMQFMVDANLFPSCFSLESLVIGDGVSVTNYAVNSNTLTIPLPAPLAPGEQVRLLIKFTLILPFSQDYTSRPVPFGYTARQTNLVDWYPTLPPFDEVNGWQINPPGYYGETNVYDLANYSVNIHIINPPADLIIAASSLPEINEGNYHYRYENARNFVWSASPLYVVSQQQVGNTVVLNYSFPFNPTANQQALRDTAQALELGNRLFTPYPRQSLSVVEADFLDGMEYDGLFFLSRGFYNNDVVPPRAYITIIAAHETAHQWFYASIGNDQAHEPWLDESLATYFERLYYEEYYPGDLAWWWATRIHYFNPTGFINRSLYDYPDYSSYRNAVYLNGALFFEELRTAMGDDAFLAFLKDYTMKYQDKVSTSKEFLTLLSSHATKDLSPVLDQFLQP